MEYRVMYISYIGWYEPYNIGQHRPAIRSCVVWSYDCILSDVSHDYLYWPDNEVYWHSRFVLDALASSSTYNTISCGLNSR